MGCNDHLKALGMSIRRRRLEMGFSQEGLADSTGLHRTYIGGIERGERNVSFTNLVRLAKALDTTVSELVQEVE